MKGYGSQRRLTAAAFSAIQTMTSTVWTAMYCGVPKKRAAASARRPNASSPKALGACGTPGDSGRMEEVPLRGREGLRERERVARGPVLADQRDPPQPFLHARQLA